MALALHIDNLWHIKYLTVMPSFYSRSLSQALTTLLLDYHECNSNLINQLNKNLTHTKYKIILYIIIISPICFVVTLHLFNLSYGTK